MSIMRFLFFILTLLSVKISFAEQIASVSLDRHFGIVISKGNRAEDLDIFISRQQDHLYSFKYCRAGGANNQSAKILEIRRQFQNADLANREKLNQLIEGLFVSEDCEAVGVNYVSFDSKEFESCHESIDFNGPKFATLGLGVVSVGGALALLMENLSSHQSIYAKKFFRFLTSQKFSPSVRATAIAAVSASAGLAYVYFKKTLDKEKNLKELTQFSFCQNGENSFRIVESMSDFKKSFLAGLNLAVESGAFTKL